MKIVDNKYRKDCFFENLKTGAIFEYDNEYYIKSDNIDANLQEQLYALNLKTGKMKCFAKNDKVLICNAKLYIE